MRVQAWLGNVVGEGRLDLADHGSQTRILAAAAWAVSAGAEGIHYDFEPVPDGDQALLETLDRTRSTVTRPANAALSVAAEPVEPLPNLAPLAGLVRPQWWSTGYLRAVASRVDQVALMSYDTAMPAERLYGGFVARQARLALAAVPAETHLLIGAPAYHTNSLTHRASAETVAAAIRGARLALTEHPGRRLFGIAL